MISNKEKDPIHIWNTFRIILDNKDIILCRQRILEIVWGDSVWEWIEILSRLGEGKKSPDYFFEFIWEDLKVSFDFQVFEKILDLYIEGKIKANNIHINIHPATLLDINFKSRISKIFMDYNFKDFHKIFFEILENGNISNIELLNFNIWYLRHLWCKIWLDDYPNDNNNNELLNLIDTLDFVKIDKSFLLSLDIKGEGILKIEIQRLIDDIRRIHPWVIIIIEGVENIDTYNFVMKELEWVNGLQWYYFGVPEKI